MNVDILFEDKDIIVAVKPAGIPSQADKTGDMDMVTVLAADKPIHVMNRLDRPVSGLILFGKNEETARLLTRQVQNKSVQKGYQAVLSGKPDMDRGEFTDWLLKNGRDNLSRVVGKGVKNAKEARLSYEILETIVTEEYGLLSLVNIRLDTGRHHQIRVQFASRQTPVFADTKYNEAMKKGRIKMPMALVSTFLSFKHPLSGEEMAFSYVPKDGIFERFIRA